MDGKLRRYLRVTRDMNTEPSFILSNNMTVAEFAFSYVIQNYKKRNMCNKRKKIKKK